MRDGIISALGRRLASRRTPARQPCVAPSDTAAGRRFPGRMVRMFHKPEDLPAIVREFIQWCDERARFPDPGPQRQNAIKRSEIPERFRVAASVCLDKGLLRGAGGDGYFLSAEGWLVADELRSAGRGGEVSAGAAATPERGDRSPVGGSGGDSRAVRRGDGKRWVWDLHPLSRHSWGNVQYPDDGTARGQTIELRRAKGMLNGEYAVVDLLPGESRPSKKMGTFTRRFYVPTEADLEIVRTKCPDNSDPAVPPWPRIEADLIAAGQSRDELVKLNAPTLLQLLAAAGSKAAVKRPGRKPDTDPKADAKLSEAWETGQHRTIADLASAFGIDESDARLALDRHRKRKERRVK